MAVIGLFTTHASVHLCILPVNTEIEDVHVSGRRRITLICACSKQSRKVELCDSLYPYSMEVGGLLPVVDTVAS